MFTLSKDWNLLYGTSRVDMIPLVYKDIENAFGPPQEGSENKISGEWLFTNEETGAVFTLYDWKSTSLYDDDLPSVEEFRESESQAIFNIGGHKRGSDLSSFKSFLLNRIEYVRLDKPFREVVLSSKEVCDE